MRPEAEEAAQSIIECVKSQIQRKALDPTGVALTARGFSTASGNVREGGSGEAN